MNMTEKNNTTYAAELFQFIERCPTAYQTVATVAELLEEQGYTMLCEGCAWDVIPGGKYMVSRNQSSIIAFALPEKLSDITGYQIMATHGDSPSFKLKAAFEQNTPQGVRWNVERYGGMIAPSWFDRPLSVAGRVVVSDENGLRAIPVDLQEDLALIPSLAIHMNRKVNEGVAIDFKNDMLPLVGLAEDTDGLLKQIAGVIGCNQENIISHDLFVYVKDNGRCWGINQELISAPRLDDLMCTWGALQGFLAGGHPNTISVLAIFDNEEIGSSSRQGAGSSMLLDVLTRVDAALGGSTEALCRRLSSSCLVSADNAHAKHPNHPEYSDGQNAPLMGRGVVIKHQAEQRYATDAVSAALFTRICQAANVPTQVYHNRSDLRGGSTLGNIVVSQVPMLTVDIGMAQLAMHSAYETAAAADISHLIHAAKAFYSTALTVKGDGLYDVDTSLI